MQSKAAYVDDPDIQGKELLSNNFMWLATVSQSEHSMF